MHEHTTVDPMPEKFESIEAAADFWDTHSLADYWDQTEEVHFDVNLHRGRILTAQTLACGLALNRPLAENGLPSLTFVAADDDLLAAATAEGLSVDNPNRHP